MTRLPTLQNWARTPTLASLTGGAVRQDFAPTDDEEQKFQGQGLVGAITGGLSAIGSVLDAPGGFVRTGLYNTFVGDSGASAGEAFLDPSKRKYGSDFLDAMGWKAPETWGGNDLGETISNSAQKLAHGLVGFAGDVVTDPLSLVGIGGKTVQGLGKVAEAQRAFGEASQAAKLGDFSKLTAAQAAGQLGAGAATSPIHVANELAQGDRALVGLHLPWWTKALGADTETPFLAGNLGMGADKAGKLAEFMGYNPATRLVRGAMSSSASPEVSRFDKAAQIANDMKTVEFARAKGAVQEMAPLFAGAENDLAAKYEDIAQHFRQSGNEASFQEFARRMQTDKACRVRTTYSTKLTKMIDPANPVDPATARTISTAA